MKMKIKFENKDYTVEVEKGKPRADAPKSWKLLGTAYHDKGNSYNPSSMRIYKAKDNTFRYALYRDGCFYEFMGKLKFLPTE